jgi:hypothetical protein
LPSTDVHPASASAAASVTSRPREVRRIWQP